MKKLISLFMLGCLIAGSPAFANEIQACFTPSGQCTQKVISVINHARKSIQLQAYELTSLNVVSALQNAKQRGVTVQLLLDRENIYDNATALDKIKAAGIPYKIHTNFEVALSNYIVIDNATLVTGSALFMDTKKVSLSDDSLFISDSSLANQYANKFKQSMKTSEPEKEFCKHSARCKFSQASGSAKKAASDVWDGTKNFWRKHISGEGGNNK